MVIYYNGERKPDVFVVVLQRLKSDKQTLLTLNDGDRSN